jgi:hypothetical protein
VYLTRFHLILMGSWMTLLALVTAIVTLTGPTLTLEVALALVALGIVPIVIVAVVFRGAPPQTIAQVLYDAERSANPTRDLLRENERRRSSR